MLDPAFDILKQAEPFVRQIQEERMNPKRIAGDMLEIGTEMIQLGREIPGAVRSILKQAREGKIKRVKKKKVKEERANPNSVRKIPVLSFPFPPTALILNGQAVEKITRLNIFEHT